MGWMGAGRDRPWRPSIGCGAWKVRLIAASRMRSVTGRAAS